MPFGEVMYRCNAHYCFSSVFRNRVVGLAITLALMQLFLFSFYLNGLHTQGAVAQSSVVGYSSEQPVVIPAPPPLPPGVEPAGAGQEDHPPVPSQATGQEAEWAGQLSSKTRLAAKKALSHIMANNKPAVNAMVAMAAKKLTESVDAPPVGRMATAAEDPMAKLGLSLLTSALSKGQTDKSKSQYANLAQMGMQLLSNNLDLDTTKNTKNSSGKSNDASAMLNFATQFMLQNSKVDPQLAKSALGFLKSAMANQKLDPKLMLNLAAKMIPQQTASQGASDFGLNLLGHMLSNGQLASTLLNGAIGQPVADLTADQSSTIYRNYLRLTSRNLPALAPKYKLPEPLINKSKVVVDLNFQFPIMEADFCYSNVSYLIVVISHVDRTDERNAARETWISDFRQLDQGTRVLFFVGRSTNATAQSLLLEEATKYRDIVQTNVQEPIENGVYKTLASLVWINNYCHSVKLLLRAEDDVYISAKRMLAMFKSVKPGPMIAGNVVSRVNPHDSKDKRNRMVENSHWPLKEFPRYILGGAYLVGRPAVPRLLGAAQVTPVFALEDVYVTGLCTVGGKVELVPNKSLFEEEISEELEVCTFEDFASWRSTGAADVRQTWSFAQAMKRSGEICVKTN